MRIFYAIFTAYALGHIYIFVCLRRIFGGGWWQVPAGLWLLFMAGIWFFRFGRSLGEGVQVASAIWMGFFIFLMYAFLTADILALTSRFLAFVTRADILKTLSALLAAKKILPLALALACLLFAWSVYEARNPKVVEVTIATDKLPPSMPELRIVGLTDIHVGPLIREGMVRRIAEVAAEARPDILVQTGDLVDTDVRDREAEAALLRAIPATYGKFAVTGNHEFYRGPEMSLEYLERCGFTTLRGQAVEAGGIIVAGVDDPTFRLRYVPDGKPGDWERAGPAPGPDTTDALPLLRELSHESFILLLSHQPHYRPESVGLFDVQYSGHTHGGQFWPGRHITGRVFGLRQGLNRLERGEHSSLLYISNGAGFWGPPIRFLTPPEVTLIRLIRTSS